VALLPAFSRVAHGDADSVDCWADQVIATGEGVVPVVAAAAFLALAARSVRMAE
jgi:hypothetical protein